MKYIIFGLFIFLLIIFSSCQSKTSKINWTSNSIFVYDTIVVIDLPNVIKLKTDELRCSEDPFSTYINYTSLINEDTVKFETEYIHYDKRYFYDDTIAHLDSTILGYMVRELSIISKSAKILSKKKYRINNVEFYCLKYNLKNLINYQILFCSSKWRLGIDIRNLKDDNIFEKIISSIKYEKAEKHICF